MQAAPVLAYDGSDARGALQSRHAAELFRRHEEARRGLPALLTHEFLGQAGSQQGLAHDEGVEVDAAVDSLHEEAHAFDGVESARIARFATVLKLADVG